MSSPNEKAAITEHWNTLQDILTSYTACQPYCCGSTRHSYKIVLLQKSCPGSSVHSQGFPRLTKTKKNFTSILVLLRKNNAHYTCNFMVLCDITI